MRTVVSTDEVMHLWANRAQDHARNQGNRVYFRGRTIYSYGEHFPMARWVENARGETAVLVTTRTYSTTTARHKSGVRSAIRHVEHKRVFNVPLASDRWHAQDSAGTDVQEYLESYRERIKTQEELVARARRPEWHYSRLVDLVDEANRFARFFQVEGGAGVEFTVREDFSELKKTLAETRREELREKREKQARIARENQERVEKWLAGENVQLPYNLERIYLRVQGDEVVTSRGAKFPVKHARIGLRLVQRVRETGEEWVTNGHTLHLGPYKVDRVSVEGDVKAGCHLVRWAEIERIAPMLEAIEVAGVSA